MTALQNLDIIFPLVNTFLVGVIAASPGTYWKPSMQFETTTFRAVAHEDMPADNADLAKMRVSFPLLYKNTPESCPIPMDEIVEYVSIESGADVDPQALCFERTARVEDMNYWIWSLTGADGGRAYVTVSQDPDRTCVGYSPDFYALTAEQFLIRDYFDIF